MLIATTKQQLRNMLLPAHDEKRRIILVPTMGALHRGHTSLFDFARQIVGANGTVVASIFVNPIQFDKEADLQTYPRQLEKDLEACRTHSVDVVFTPEASDMYESDRSIFIDENSLSTTLCGASRPGHFSGVCTVVTKLFNLVSPTDAVFGKKDYQQLAILRRMVRDLDVSITLHGAEIVREESGLALSSRNQRLSEEQLKQAPQIYQALQEAANSGKTKASELCEIVEARLAKIPNTKIDYLQVVNSETMQPVSEISGPSLMAIAIWFGDVRLIDNIEINK